MQVIERIKINDILSSGAKIVFVFYGYTEADDKNYISKHGKEPNYTINFSGMRNDNVRFIYYDEEDNKFTLLSGELKETGSNGDNNIYFFESSDFSAQFSLVSSYLKFYIDKFQFIFLSYKDIHSDNNTTGAGSITCISEECANQEVYTKQCEGEIKVSLTLTGKKETISQLKDLPVYMYIDYSKEIIDSTITLSDELTAKSDFGFKAESKSNLSLRFSFYKSLYNTTKTGNEIETLSHSLHIDKGYSGSYEFNDKFNAKYFPDIIEITGIKLLSYNDKSLEILLLSNVKNTDKKSTEILKYIKWKFFVTDKLVDDRAVEKTAGLSNKSITIYDLDDKIYNNSVVSGNKLQLYYTDKFLELYNTVIQNQNSTKSLVLYPYIAYSEFNINKQNEEYLKHALVIRNSGINKFTGVLSVTISEVKSDEHGIYTELEAHHNSKLVTPQINDVKWGYLILDKACIVFDKAKIVPMEQYGKTIKVYYNEEWYNKYLYFFPYYKSVDINLYSLWHIEQPVSLKFNGERLEILSNQVKEGSFQHYIKENYQSCILPAKEPEQEKVIELFPKSDKMAEGEYYILLDEIENSIIPVYKPNPVCYDTHYGFTFSKTENTISKYQLLGGCKSIYLFNEYQEFVLKLKEIIKNKYNNKLYTYQGKTPIKLEVKYSKDWHEPLDTMEINIYNYDGNFKPSSAVFGYARLEDNVTHKQHQGVDLFAIPKITPVYASVECKVVSSYYGESGGNIVIVRVEDSMIPMIKSKILNSKYNKSYAEFGETDTGYAPFLKFPVRKNSNIVCNDFNYDSNIITFRYMHLDKVLVKKHDILNAGDIIGYAGVTGDIANNTQAPHLHIEVLSTLQVDAYGMGDRLNPGYLFTYKTFPNNEQLIDDEIKFRQKNWKTILNNIE